MKKLVAESLNEFNQINEITFKPKRPAHPDLTRVTDKSLGAQLEPLIRDIAKYGRNPNTLKDKFFEIVNDPNIHLSDKKRIEYIQNMKQKHSFSAISNYITNIYLKAANLGL